MFSYWPMTRGSNVQKNATFGCCMQKLCQIFFWRCSRIISSIWIHANFGDVLTMMMAILDRVQFWMNLLYEFLPFDGKMNKVEYLKCRIVDHC